MGLFSEFNKTASIYVPVDNNNNDTVTYPISPTSTLSMHIIRRDEIEAEIMGDEVADYESNPDGDVTAAITRDAKVIWDSKTFKVIGTPEYLPLIKKTKVRLKRKTDSI